MNAVTDIVARPILPIEAIWVLGIAALLVALLGLRRGLRGAWLRVGAAVTLMAALIDPALINEDRAPLSDIAVIVVDESASQTIDRRSETTKRAVDDLTKKIAESRTADTPLELRVVKAPGHAKDGTKLLTALAAATEDIPRERFAGAILVTDGAISDAELRAPAIALTPEGKPTAPIHALITGRPNEYDRRIEVVAAPAFGIVDEKTTIRFKVIEDGTPPAGASTPVVEVYIDGKRKLQGFSPVGRVTDLTFKLERGGATAVEIRTASVKGEITDRNNIAVFSINGVREALKVLLVSGEPHPGERAWRNLLKSDPSVELVHFTILKPPEKDDRAEDHELALIPFPTEQLFQEKLDSFDLIIFDRFRHRPRVLYDRYLRNIANFARRAGKAVLVSTGPAFAGAESLSLTPLSSILPAAPTGRVVEGAFRPELTMLGRKHPVTRGLKGANTDKKPAEWGRWFRRLEVEALAGDLLMQAQGGGPLLFLNRVGEGRVGLIASDHTWLWARGFDGGGPQAELLRRVVHWLLHEPELEEDALTAKPAPGGYEVTRRSLIDGDKKIRAVAPDGVESEILLTEEQPGVWRALVKTETLGAHRLTDAKSSVISAASAPRKPLSAVAVVGPPSPREFAEPISTTKLLAPTATATAGAVLRLSAGAPELRRPRAGRPAAGDGWIGLVRREAYEVRGVTLAGVAPSWLLFGLAALMVVAAWRVEGR
ncbi:MAG: hypothetical protein MRY74_13340 [Neomegalonema sp.]|nr:hypothetical protein [Neomegalonema sp.]